LLLQLAAVGAAAKMGEVAGGVEAEEWTDRWVSMWWSAVVGKKMLEAAVHGGREGAGFVLMRERWDSLWGCWREGTMGLLLAAVGKKKIKREGLCVVGWKRKRRWGHGVEAEWRR
jgi:hypothetical protein